FDVVTRATRRTKVSFEYADESDRVGYPIPKRVHIEYGSDHHALLVERDACRLYELGGLTRASGRWRAWAGAVWNLRSNRLRPAGSRPSRTAVRTRTVPTNCLQRSWLVQSKCDSLSPAQARALGNLRCSVGRRARGLVPSGHLDRALAPGPKIGAASADPPGRRSSASRRTRATRRHRAAGARSG